MLNYLLSRSTFGENNLLNQKKTKITIFAILLISCCGVSIAKNTVNNPVLPGDFPDPSIIRVNNNYWATSTSSEWAPEFPIFNSKDMNNWKITGSVFKQKPSWSVGNFWAPEISYHKGKYYVYYTARKKDGPLCVAVAVSDKADSNYKDYGPLVCEQDGSIDGMPVTDNNGDRYLTWKEDGNSQNLATPIWIQKLSNEGTKLVGVKKELFRNKPDSWEGNLVEAPFIKKHNNMFYMFYSANACCGTECNYAMGVARSKNLLGPWEKNPANPILKSNNIWKCPGHGSIATDKNGKDFMLYHAYNVKSNVFSGRQGLVDEVIWGKNGWPTINNGNGPSFNNKYNIKNVSFIDEFNKPVLDKSWQWPQNSEPVIKLSNKNNGILRLSSKSKDDLSETAGLIGHSGPASDYTMQTSIDLKTLKTGTLAGISAYGDKENALGLSVKGNNLLLWKRERNKYQEISNISKPKSDTIHLKINASKGYMFNFEYSIDNKKWVKLSNSIEGKFIPPWDRGVRASINVGGIENAYADFNNFKIIPINF